MIMVPILLTGIFCATVVTVCLWLCYTLYPAYTEAVSDASICIRANFWDVAPYRYCVNGRFGGTYHLHRQGRRKIRLHLLTLVRSWISSFLPPKRRLTQYLHGPTSQKTAFFIVTAVETSNLTLQYFFNVRACLRAGGGGAPTCVRKYFVSFQELVNFVCKFISSLPWLENKMKVEPTPKMSYIKYVSGRE
jgi:hypothetical protein